MRLKRISNAIGITIFFILSVSPTFRPFDLSYTICQRLSSISVFSSFRNILLMLEVSMHWYCIDSYSHANFADSLDFLLYHIFILYAHYKREEVRPASPNRVVC